MASSSTTEPVSDYQVETLGVSQGVVRHQDAQSDLLSHWLLRITMRPGAALPRAEQVTSMLIHVESGSVLVTVENPDVQINVGQGGELIAPSPDVVLKRGHMISLKRSTFVVRTTEAEPAVLMTSVLLPYDDTLERCWICPSPW